MDNPYIKENEEGVISFDLLKLERGIKKICRCEKPHFEVDAKNRLVLCKDCGAIIEPFEALMEIAKRMEGYKEFQKHAIEKAKAFSELADKEIKRKFKNQAFKEMEVKYLRENLHPHCPKCGEQINPIKITRWSRMVAEDEKHN